MDYIIYVSIGFAVLGVLSFFNDLYVKKNGTIVVLVITRCKNKTKKSRSYCYPKVEGLDGKEFYVYSAQKNGHDKYIEGDTMDFYQHPITNKYKSLAGFYYRTLSLLGFAVLIFAAQMFLQ